MRTTLAILFLLWCGAASAQSIESPDTDLTVPYIATARIKPPAMEGAKHKFALTSDPGAKVRQFGDELAFTSGGGKHWIVVEGVSETTITKTVLVPGPNWATDKSDVKVETFTYPGERNYWTARYEFEANGGGPPPLPEPKPGTLGALVPEAARPTLAEFYADWAKVVRAGKVKSTGHFRAKHIEAMATVQDVLTASGWAAINGPVSAKITAAVGLEDVSLDSAKQAALARALDSIAADFRGT